MSHPRAAFPPDVITYYLANGHRQTCIAYRCGWSSLRRWLTDRGVTIRKHGLRVGRKSRAA